MRTGFSTSACAAAAAAAALQCLVTGATVREVVIRLPTVRQAHFAVCRCERQGDGVLCGVVKPASDDPDATAGIEVQAHVAPADGDIVLAGGPGVGIATLPGLPVAVGQPAINPGSRRLIRQVILDAQQALGLIPGTGLAVTIIVPEGERVAAQTMNAKLGIVGGISILGTDGIVRPYSAPAFRTSLYYELQVARQAGYTMIGLATGKRSAAYLRTHLGDAPGRGVLDVGDEIQYPLAKAAQLGFERVVLGGMIGKFSKVAQGRLQTHVQQGEVDFDFLAELAARLGAPRPLAARIRTARTAHQVQNWLNEVGIRLEPEIARHAAEQAAATVERRLAVQVVIFTLEGDLLAQAQVDADTRERGTNG